MEFEDSAAGVLAGVALQQTEAHINGGEAEGCQPINNAEGTGAEIWADQGVVDQVQNEDERHPEGHQQPPVAPQIGGEELFVTVAALKHQVDV